MLHGTTGPGSRLLGPKTPLFEPGAPLDAGRHSGTRLARIVTSRVFRPGETPPPDNEWPERTPAERIEGV